MNIQIYVDDKLIDRKNIYTNFKEKLEIQKYILEISEINNIDFSVIHTLKGDKELLNKSFRHELTENTLD